MTAIVSATSLRGWDVYDRSGAKLGAIEDFILSWDLARIEYALVGAPYKRGGGVPVPLPFLQLDSENHCFVFLVADD